MDYNYVKLLHVKMDIEKLNSYATTYFLGMKVNKNTNFGRKYAVNGVCIQKFSYHFSQIANFSLTTRNGLRLNKV